MHFKNGITIPCFYYSIREAKQKGILTITSKNEAGNLGKAPAASVEGKWHEGASQGDCFSPEGGHDLANSFRHATDMCEKILCNLSVSVGTGHSTDQDTMQNDNHISSQMIDCSIHPNGGDMAEEEDCTYVHKYFMALGQHLLKKEESLRAVVAADIIPPAKSIGFIKLFPITDDSEDNQYHFAPFEDKGNTTQIFLPEALVIHTNMCTSGQLIKQMSPYSST